MEQLLEKFKEIKHLPSFEAEKEEMYAYVFYTNKLEGNALTYLQTIDLLLKNIISGDNIKITDILEQQGMYNALVKMLVAVKNKEQLSLELLKKLHGTLLAPLWNNEAAYINAKAKGQELDNFKVSENSITCLKNNEFIKEIKPFSSLANVAENMQELIDKVNNSATASIDKAVFLAQELWLHQPFVDGNKRMARLMINFLTMKEGYPLFNYTDKEDNFNSLLVEEFQDKKPNLILDFVKKQLAKKMNEALKRERSIIPNENLGYRMTL